MVREVQGAGRGTGVRGRRSGPTRRLAVGLAVLLVVSLVPTTLAGSGDDISEILNEHNRLEADRWDDTSGACDPDYDNERTRSRERDWATEDSVVFLPHGSCWVDYHDVELATPGLFTAYRLDTTGDLGHQDAEVEVRVLADGDIIARDVYEHEGGDHAPHTRLFDADSLRPVLPGTHDIRITYRVHSGPNFLNINVDYLEMVPLSCAEVPAASIKGLSTDGMVGDVLWRDRDYTARIDQMDAPGGTAVGWELPDGADVDEAGGTIPFDALGDLPLVASLSVPAPDCADLETIHVTSILNLDILRPSPLRFDPNVGNSCVDGVEVPTLDGPDRIVGSCTVEARVPPGLGNVPARIEMTQDGDLLRTVDGSRIGVDYRSRDHAEGLHTFRACATFPSDIHDVEICGSRTLVNQHAPTAP